MPGVSRSSSSQERPLPQSRQTHAQWGTPPSGHLSSVLRSLMCHGGLELTRRGQINFVMTHGKNSRKTPLPSHVSKCRDRGYCSLWACLREKGTSSSLPRVKWRRSPSVWVRWMKGRYIFSSNVWILKIIFWYKGFQVFWDQSINQTTQSNTCSSELDSATKKGFPRTFSLH